MAIFDTKQHGKVYADIPKIVNHYAALGMLEGIKNGSGGNIQAHCPSQGHDDNSPSWGINLHTGKHHCFGCGWAGDPLNLIKELESSRQGRKVKLDEATEIMLRVSAGQLDQQAIISPVKRLRAVDDSREFRYYPDSILDAIESKVDYLVERGVSERVCHAWQVRYGEDEKRYIIPVRDIRNRLVGFIGLADSSTREDNKDNPSFKKVIYSPKLWISKILLGVHRYPICSKDILILVEGAVDCLKVSTAVGPKVAVMAALHSDLSVHQAKLLKDIKYQRVLLMADNDKAGDKLREKVKDRLDNVVDVQYEDDDPGDMSVESISEVIRKLI